jgi:hypothetical protein
MSKAGNSYERRIVNIQLIHKTRVHIKQRKLSQNIANARTVTENKLICSNKINIIWQRKKM